MNTLKFFMVFLPALIVSILIFWLGGVDFERGAKLGYSLVVSIGIATTLAGLVASE